MAGVLSNSSMMEFFQNCPNLNIFITKKTAAFVFIWKHSAQFSGTLQLV